MTTVLLVEDDPQLLRILRINFHARRYSALTASTGQQALDSVSAQTPDAVLLDLGLPDFDGVDVLSGIRAAITGPIIVLSGRDELTEKIRALDAGADDYLTKPFEMDELFARLRSTLRRSARALPPQHEPAVIGEHRIDIGAGTVTGPGGPVRLTPTEWRILKLLLADPGQLVSRRQILGDVWGPGHDKHGNYLRVYLAALRRKLEPDPAHPRHLITEPGIGYRYQP
jgi:two-component system KDP operon response regulator KdpE